MFKKIIDFYKVSEPIPAKASTPEENERKLKRLQWATFLSATIGYGTYYVCRLSLNVIKKPIVDNGVFSETELVSSALSCSSLTLSVSLPTVSLLTEATSSD